MTGTTPYNDLIMDHIKNARNYRKIEDADRCAEESNPLCGDSISVYVRTMEERVADVGYQCECCGISMASASIMTESVLGRNLADARAILGSMVDIINGRAALGGHAFGPAQLAILQIVRDLRSRARCAALPWVALQAALDESARAVNSVS
jgi:nitrogen fixation protein NifU and related proteins